MESATDLLIQQILKKQGVGFLDYFERLAMCSCPACLGDNVNRTTTRSYNRTLFNLECRSCNWSLVGDQINRLAPLHEDLAQAVESNQVSQQALEDWLQPQQELLLLDQLQQCLVVTLQADAPQTDGYLLAYLVQQSTRCLTWAAVEEALGPPTLVAIRDQLADYQVRRLIVVGDGDAAKGPEFENGGGVDQGTSFIITQPVLFMYSILRARAGHYRFLQRQLTDLIVRGTPIESGPLRADVQQTSARSLPRKRLTSLIGFDAVANVCRESPRESRQAVVITTMSNPYVEIQPRTPRRAAGWNYPR